MSSSISNNESKTTYVYKHQKLYGRVVEQNFELFENGEYILANDKKNEIIDILPEGIDLQIMLRVLNAKNPIELLPYLKNTIGDFDFSANEKKEHFDKPIISNIKLEPKFPNVIPCTLDIIPDHLNPNIYTPNSIQKLSLSGYQHKLQVSIIDNVIKEDYGNFILKPYNDNYSQLPENEHLNVSFMREFGFEVPLNAIVFARNNFHYLIKRFDIDENGNKLPQISLNALMKSSDKYKGTIEEISTFLKDRLDSTQKMQFLKYIYANALIHNNDLHKKNISFIFKDNELKLSPVYDVVNCYPIRRAGNEQCVLTINEKDDYIKINDFKKSSQNLELDFKEVQKNLQEMQDIYLTKYPQYVKNLMKTPNIDNILNFKEKLLESHKKTLDELPLCKSAKYIGS